MGIQIVGSRNNISANVNNAGKLETQSISLNSPSYVNLVYERSYIILNTVTPEPSGDVFYIKNLNEAPLVLVGAEFWCGGDEKITLWRNPTGTPTGGTEITPANCNFGSGILPIGYFYSGSSLDGLDQGELRNIIRLNANSQIRYEFTDWTIIPKNSTFKMSVENGNNELDFWFQIFYAVGLE